MWHAADSVISGTHGHIFAVVFNVVVCMIVGRLVTLTLCIAANMQARTFQTENFHANAHGHKYTQTHTHSLPHSRKHALVYLCLHIDSPTH